MASYVPEKIRRLTEELLQTEDIKDCLEKVRAQYPNVATRKTVLCRIKMLVLDAGVRHPDFERHMNEQYQFLTQLHRSTGSSDDLCRIVALQNFYKCPLKRQLQIQKKLLIDGATDICSGKDRRFYVNLPIVPTWVNELHLTNEESQNVAANQLAGLRKKSNDVVKVENADELIQKCCNILRDNAPDPCELAVALALCTGRRMVEIFCKGTFEPKDRYTVLFSGRAKAGLTTIKSMNTDHERRICIPVLASSKKIARGIELLRLYAGKDINEQEVNRKWCKKLNVCVKKLIHPGLGFHDLRTMYVLITFEAFKPHKYGLNGWVAKTLDHVGINISVHYTTMQVFGMNKLLHRYNKTPSVEFEIRDEPECKNPPLGQNDGVAVL
jgi:hypothetical protein